MIRQIVEGVCFAQPTKPDTEIQTAETEPVFAYFRAEVPSWLDVHLLLRQEAAYLGK